MQHTITLSTKCASAERVETAVIQAQHAYFNDFPMMNSMLDAIPNMVLVLNNQRQIVYANQRFQEAFGDNDVVSLLGERPGEVIECVHAREEPGGCGTAEACSTCGALKAILVAQKGQATVEECHIQLEKDDPGALDLRVWTTPTNVQDEHFVIFAIDDISDEKRRQALERLFFHDIINTAGAIQGLVNMLGTMTDPAEFRSYNFGEMLTQASTQLLDEILAQRQLLSAERGQLRVEPRTLQTQALMETVANLYRNHQVGYYKHVVVAPDSDDVTLVADQALMVRVLGNMVKNALEASDREGTVTLGCEHVYDYVRFWVHNDGAMPRRVQLQVFKRSFSTKGEGRGLGTYSIKLLTEKYLQGRVSFESNEAKGTTFWAMAPLVWLAPDAPADAPEELSVVV